MASPQFLVEQFSKELEAVGAALNVLRLSIRPGKLDEVHRLLHFAQVICASSAILGVGS
jgi:hypothetical protein